MSPPGLSTKNSSRENPLVARQLYLFLPSRKPLDAQSQVPILRRDTVEIGDRDDDVIQHEPLHH